MLYTPVKFPSLFHVVMLVWRRFINLVLPQPTEVARELEALPVEAPPLVVEPKDIIVPVPPDQRSHSEVYRRYERARRKFDTFATPQGTKPKKQNRAKVARPTTKAEEVLPEPPETLLIDVHHSDRKTDVLYADREMYGEFNFRDTILDQLERYFVYIKRMRKHDQGAYDFYRQVGASLVPYVAIPDLWWLGKDVDKSYNDKLAVSPWFMRTRPSFGCIVYGGNSVGEAIEADASLVGLDGRKEKRRLWVPKFIYFTKYTLPPCEIQPTSGGDVYKVTVWWDRPQDGKMKYGVPSDFAIFVGQDGTLRALRMLETRMLTIPGKKVCGRKHAPAQIPQRSWRIPQDYEAWAKMHHTDARHLLIGIFVDATRRMEFTAFSMIRVSVQKGTNHALFSLDVKRTPYFFQDRDYDLTDSGLRKRIFHVVRPHTRKDGSVTRLHFRGQREFTWAGYQVKITVPGRDHLMMEEFDLGVIDERWVERKEEYVGAAHVGKTLRDEMDRVFEG